MNVGNFSQTSDSRIEYQATMRAADVVQNTNGIKLTVFSNIFVDGQHQFIDSVKLQVRTCKLQV